MKRRHPDVNHFVQDVGEGIRPPVGGNNQASTADRGKNNQEAVRSLADEPCLDAFLNALAVPIHTAAPRVHRTDGSLAGAVVAGLGGVFLASTATALGAVGYAQVLALGYALVVPRRGAAERIRSADSSLASTVAASGDLVPVAHLAASAAWGTAG